MDFVTCCSAKDLSPHQQQVRSTLTSPKTMDAPLSRSAAYRLRNRTTHSWSQDASANSSTHDPMTMSCPNARSLEEHMRKARTHVPRDPNPSPVIVKAKGIASPATSPGGGVGQNQRPASCYTYDGGFFLSPSNAKDFVIHPDWVSEAITVNKVSLLERGGRSRTPAKSTAMHGSGAAGESGSSQRRARRCKSAPPPKHRNPITWSWRSL